MWPWLALVVSFGGLALIVLIVVLWGAGRGPEARLDRPADPHDEPH